jgi:hypothetical protein
VDDPPRMRARPESGASLPPMVRAPDGVAKKRGQKRCWPKEAGGEGPEVVRRAKRDWYQTPPGPTRDSGGHPRARRADRSRPSLWRGPPGLCQGRFPQGGSDGAAAEKHALGQAHQRFSARASMRHVKSSLPVDFCVLFQGLSRVGTGQRSVAGASSFRCPSPASSPAYLPPAIAGNAHSYRIHTAFISTRR